MDPKELSPAYYTSLGLILLGAFLTGLSSNFLAVLGWILLIPGVALNLFSTQVMIQKHKDSPLPGVFTDDTSTEAVPTVTDEEPEPDTETQQVITPTEKTGTEPSSDEKIFRPRSTRPRVR